MCCSLHRVLEKKLKRTIDHCHGVMLNDWESAFVGSYKLNLRTVFTQEKAAGTDLILIIMEVRDE